MLRKWLKPGSTVYCVMRHVSQSGMQRRIDLYTILYAKMNGKRRPYMQYLSGYAADLLGTRRSDKGGIVVNGCGMDMGFHLVYELSMALFCPTKYDHDAAYALNYQWL